MTPQKMNNDSLLQAITQWAESETSIRAVLLLGSRAQNDAVDNLSDYDISIFSETPGSYTQSERWLTSIGKPLLCVHEKVYRNEVVFPTRLVIFEDGKKVDFSFFTLDVLQEIAHESVLSGEYEMGYRVLVDKDDCTKNMPQPSFKARTFQKPNKEEFQRIVTEFWFEVYHVAKYLKREDLWLVKSRVASIHEHFLLPMLQWHTAAKSNWTIAINPSCKNMHTWIDEDTWKALFQAFAHFDQEDSQQALKHTLQLFRDLAHGVAANLGYKYPQEIDAGISSIISHA